MKKGISTIAALVLIAGLAGCGNAENNDILTIENTNPTGQIEEVQQVEEEQYIEAPELEVEKVKDDILANADIQKHKGQDVEIIDVNIENSSIVQLSKLGRFIGVECDIHAEVKVLAGDMHRITNYYVIYTYIPENSENWELESVEFEGRAKYVPTKALDVSEIPDWVGVTSDTKMTGSEINLENNLVVYKFKENNTGKEFIVNCSIDEMNGTWVFEKLYTENKEL